MKFLRPSKRVALGLGGGLVAAASAALFMNGATNIRIPGASDLAAMMQERSPGARAEGALAKKAPMMAAAAPVARVPQKQALPVAAVPGAAAPAAALTPAPVPISALPAAAVVPAVVPAGASGLGLLPLPLVFGDGNNRTTTIVNNVPPPPTPPGETPPPPAPPIPEPGTWLMMISGFGLLGLALRRRRRLLASKVEDGARIAAYPTGAVRQS